MKIKSKYSQIAIAACLIELGDNAPTDIQLTPSGTFKARDGRPHDLDGWVMTASSAQLIIELINQQADQLLIDYEHQTLNAAKNGQPNPAAGWFKSLEWREGVGLFAVGVDWTDKAKAAIAAKEYRYISPVFTFDQTNGIVTSLLMAALVNTPALDGMKDLTAAANTLFMAENTMDIDELLEKIRYWLNLPTLASTEDIMNEIDKLKAAIQASDAVIAAKNAEIVALKAEQPNPAEFVPVSVMTALQTELTALKTDLATDKRNQLITVALSDGRLLPAQKQWAESLTVDGLQSFIATVQPIAALSRMQSGGNEPQKSIDVNDADSIATAAASYQFSEQQAGRDISVAAAVAHVTHNKG